MLKITIQEDPGVTTLKLEGRVVGPWTRELQRAWESLAASLGPRKLLIDLCGVTHMDADGTRVLAEMRRKTHADFLADTVKLIVRSAFTPRAWQTPATPWPLAGAVIT